MSLNLTYVRNVLVKDSYLLKLLPVAGFGSQTFICGLNRQNICSVFTRRKVHQNQNASSEIIPIHCALVLKVTPFENPQRWMGQNTFPILLLNDDNMIGEH